MCIYLLGSYDSLDKLEAIELLKKLAYIRCTVYIYITIGRLVER